MCLDFWDFQGKNELVIVEICCNRLDVFVQATDKMMPVQVYTFRFGLHIRGACNQVVKAS
jgi:hypothetical protein